MNSAGRVELARIPPTVAAATITTSGRLAWIQSSVGCWRRKSTSARPTVKISQFSLARRRTMALPTIPRCPATKMRRPARPNSSAAALGALMLLSHGDEIRRDHLGHQLAKAGPVPPAQPAPGLGRIAMKIIHLGRAEIAGIDRDQHLAVLRIDPLFLGAGAAPGDAPTHLGEGEIDEFPHGV